MSETKATYPNKTTRRWLYRALTAVSVVAVLAILLAWQPWSAGSDQRAAARAQAALAKLQSYRVILTGSAGSDLDSSNTTIAMEFAAPDRYHVTEITESGSYEFILIGDQNYSKGQDVSSFAMRLVTGLLSDMLKKEATFKALDSLKDIKRLPDVTVDDTACFHYSGIIDVEKQTRAYIQQIQESNAKEGLPPLSKETQQGMIQEAQSTPRQVLDFWIGRDDYLPRQMKMDGSGHGVEAEWEFRFSDFNQPITIEAPTDANGQLLPGWTSA